MQEFGGKNVVPLVESNQFLKNTFEYFKEEFPIFLATVDCDLKDEKHHTVKIYFKFRLYARFFCVKPILKLWKFIILKVSQIFKR